MTFFFPIYLFVIIFFLESSLLIFFVFKSGEAEYEFLKFGNVPVVMGEDRNGNGQLDEGEDFDRDGNIGFGVNRPAHPLELPSGAHVSAGGVWTNASSRDYKENISTLDIDDALAALSALEPVEYNYRSHADEHHVGFIAEDVPDLVATSNRKGLSPMDIVAVLTRVVQAQEARIRELEERLDGAGSPSQ